MILLKTRIRLLRTGTKMTKMAGNLQRETGIVLKKELARMCELTRNL